MGANLGANQKRWTVKQDTGKMWAKAGTCRRSHFEIDGEPYALNLYWLFLKEDLVAVKPREVGRELMIENEFTHRPRQNIYPTLKFLVFSFLIFRLLMNPKGEGSLLSRI
jgi:hypothetical protein